MDINASAEVLQAPDSDTLGLNYGTWYPLLRAASLTLDEMI
jgi:hypothetical protein